MLQAIVMWCLQNQAKCSMGISPRFSFLRKLQIAMLGKIHSELKELWWSEIAKGHVLLIAIYDKPHTELQHRLAQDIADALRQQLEGSITVDVTVDSILSDFEGKIENVYARV